MPRLLAVSRHREILDRLTLADTVTMKELARELRVSRETIGRDLRALAGQDRLSVVHGGALRPGRPEAPFSDWRAEIARLSLDLAFVGVGGIDGEGCMTDYGRGAASLRSAMLGATPFDPAGLRQQG